MAAGGSVVLPLVCVLIVQLRKSKREERRRLQQSRQAAEEGSRAEEAAGHADAPPAYEELFGGAGETVSVTSTSSLDSGLGTDDHRRGSGERLVGERAGIHGVSTALTSSSSSSLSSASSSSSPVASDSLPVSALIAYYPPPSISASGAAAVSPLSEIRRTSTTSSDSTTSNTSTEALLPPSTISDGHVIHHDPPPPYDWPGHGGRSNHVTVVLPAGSDTTIDMSPPPPSHSAPAVQPSSGRRFLGMHLSIFDLMAVIYPDPVPTPPPSYDDALKILALPSRPQVQVT
ncbi:integrator complex subunit 6 homolog [Littorina saxatilis]